MAEAPTPKPTGFIIGAMLEGLLMIGFGAFIGIDHAILFVGLCGLLFSVAIMKTAITPSDPQPTDGKHPDHARIAGINRMFPQSVIIAAVAVAVFSLAIGTETIHSFARDTLGFSQQMTEPFVRL